MTEIQEIILKLEQKIKEQSEAVEQAQKALGISKSMLQNDIKALEKIIAGAKEYTTD